MWFSGGINNVRLVDGLCDPEGLLQPKQLYDLLSKAGRSSWHSEMLWSFSVLSLSSLTAVRNQSGCNGDG